MVSPACLSLPPHCLKSKCLTFVTRNRLLSLTGAWSWGHLWRFPAVCYSCVWRRTLGSPKFQVGPYQPGRWGTLEGIGRPNHLVIIVYLGGQKLACLGLFNPWQWYKMTSQRPGIEKWPSFPSPHSIFHWGTSLSCAKPWIIFLVHLSVYCCACSWS